MQEAYALWKAEKDRLQSTKKLLDVYEEIIEVSLTLDVCVCVYVCMYVCMYVYKEIACIV